MATTSYNELLVKINEFIRKFYLNKILRGSIYASAILLLLYLFIFISFYYLHPPTAVKTIIFFSFLIIGILTVGFLIIKPLFAMLKLGRRLSLDEASVIIGNHFADIKDKLLNTLQLHQLAENNPANTTLILASIDQKIVELRPVPFYSAVRIDENKKYLKYLLVPISIIVLISIFSPIILKQGTYSFIKYGKYIPPTAPFQFVIANKSLNVTQGDDVNIAVKIVGNDIPNEVYVADGKNTYKLEKKDLTNFNFAINNIQSDKKLIFKGAGFSSKVYAVTVRPKAELLTVAASLSYPKYLSKKSEKIDNVGELLIPEGTEINWQIKTAKSDVVVFLLNHQPHSLPVQNNSSNFSSEIRENASYSILPKNQFSNSKDSLSHQISVIKDQFPSIEVKEKTDSISSRALYFSGQVQDDYGFSRLSFKYYIKENGKLVSSTTKNIAIKANVTVNNFFLFWDLRNIDLKQNQSLEYYFEVADNDGVNGAKVSKSSIKTFVQPTKQEISEQLNANSSSLKQKMQSAIRLANTVQTESKKIADKLIDKKEISFEDKKDIEALLDKKKQLDEAIKQIKDLNDKSNQQRQENQEQTETLKEKQAQIKNLFDNVLDEKTKALLQKLQALMNQQAKDSTKDELSKMQIDNKGLKNELDRILELYKQLEFDQGLENNINRLNELSKNQQKLSDQPKASNLDKASAKQKQDDLIKQLEEVKDDLAKLNDKNKQLDRPNAFDDPKDELQQIQKDQQDSKDALDKSKPKEASQKQKDAADGMQKLAEKMKQMNAQGAEAENNVDAKELRKLLENLLTTSFTQEKIMLALKQMSTNDPSYRTNVQEQRTVKDNLKTIADSLYSLSRRVPQIESTVNQEMNAINFNLTKSLESLADRRTAEGNRYQQFTMTSINNLALMLNEALEQLQKANKNAKGGKGKKKQSMQQLRQMQEQLNKNMQQAKQQMQKEGNKGKVGAGQMSQEFAKMAQQQQMIRQALEKINREDNKDGSGKMGNLNETVQEMKKTESDLVNKRLEEETIKRQKDLVTKLLDAEKADREQDEDSKREAKAAKQFPPSYQQRLKEYQQQKANGEDLLQKLPPALNYYYKNKIAEYLKLLTN
ncbi:hypothetical protein ABIB40_001025 [Pedobacter sp. UYP30]|uniref:hypothetical protein n=1 Tax=Pedobacter sp. UYP30 TaxID=1756400 RepID=UPI0033947764